MFDEKEIENISFNDISDIYCDADELERLNFFFTLSGTYHTLVEHGAKKEILAHLCSLLTFYVFFHLTPPNSEVLGRAYIRKAIELMPDNEVYKEEYQQVLRGN